MNIRIWKSVLLMSLSFVLLQNSGCQSLTYKLRPSQLWKLNRGPELGRDSYNFSIPPADEAQLLHDLVKETEAGLEPQNQSAE